MINMPHLRDRHLISRIKKMATFWPIVGLVGPRQVGKTTLFKNLLNIEKLLSLDDIELREEANNSPKSFLSKFSCPLIIDEIQKAPNLFDTLKLFIDRKKVPGSYFITGSSKFTSKIDIRESLTGRIGLVDLHPMTHAELTGKPFRSISALNDPSELKESARNFYPINEISQTIVKGGFPVPAFLRNESENELYWKGWLDTTLYRDLAKQFKGKYDSDYAFSIIEHFGRILRDGELPSLKHFPFEARRLRNYLTAMESIYLLRKIPCHESGFGKEVWLFIDSGLAAFVMKKNTGEGPNLSLIRHFVLNELSARIEIEGLQLVKSYYKSPKGAPVDLVLEGVPVKIVGTSSAITRHYEWEKKALLGAMKRLKSKKGLMLGPIDNFHIEKDGISVLPLAYWS